MDKTIVLIIQYIYLCDISYAVLFNIFFIKIIYIDEREYCIVYKKIHSNYLGTVYIKDVCF